MRSKRFEPIQQIASTSATDLSRVMGEAARRVADLEAQLQQLTTYRREYLDQSATERGALDAVRLQNYRSFIDRLGEAVRQHSIKLDAARGDYDRCRLQWSAKRIEAQSLGRVIDRFRNEERHAEEKREQRDGDDAAMRIALKASV